MLLDENLSPQLVSMLPDSFSGSLHVSNAEMGKKTDSNIWAFARANGFAILPKDSDFAKRADLDRDGPKIVWLRLGNCLTEEIRRFILLHESGILAFRNEQEPVCLILRRGPGR